MPDDVKDVIGLQLLGVKEHLIFEMMTLGRLNTEQGGRSDSPNGNAFSTVSTESTFRGSSKGEPKHQSNLACFYNPWFMNHTGYLIKRAIALFGFK